MCPSRSMEANKVCACVCVCEIAECRAIDRKRKSRQMPILSRLVKRMRTVVLLLWSQPPVQGSRALADFK